MLRAIVERHLNEIDGDVFVKIANDHKLRITHLSDTAQNAVSGMKSDKVWDWQAIESVHNLEYIARCLGEDVDRIVSSWKSDLAHIERAVSTILEEFEK